MHCRVRVKMADGGRFPSRLMARQRCKDSRLRSVIVKCARVQRLQRQRRTVYATAFLPAPPTACSSSIFLFTDTCCPRRGTARCHDDAAAPRSVIRVFCRQMYHPPIARRCVRRSEFLCGRDERAIIAGRRT